MLCGRIVQLINVTVRCGGDEFMDSACKVANVNSMWIFDRIESNETHN